MKIALILATLALALSFTPAAHAKPENKELMLQFLSELTALKKYMFSESAFKATENEAEIAAHLKEFSRLAKQARHYPDLDAPNFTFSRQVLEEHIVDTERIFSKGNKTYARWQLNATVGICASCHSQLPATSKHFSEFKDLSIFSSDFDKAEFQFAIRNFDDALPLYRFIVNGFPANKAFHGIVEFSIERELTYQLRVKRDPKAALALLKEHRSNENLWPGLQANIDSWSKKLSTLSEKKAPELASMSKKKFDQYFKANPVKDADLVTQLYTSGLLLEFLNTQKTSKLVPDVLYQLALCERGISHNFFFSLADFYLKECMLNYPEAPVASKCYAAYEEETILSYTGSSGTNVPDDVKSELANLKKLVKNKGKVQIDKNAGKK